MADPEMEAAPPQKLVASGLSFLPQADGSEKVIIGTQTLALSDLLLSLLKLLAQDDGTGDDELVRWKTGEEVDQWHQAQIATPVKRDSLNNLIYRLRAERRRAKLSSSLVQSHKRRGLRFALRRQIDDVSI
jgi:hypothetical protein